MLSQVLWGSILGSAIALGCVILLAALYRWVFAVGYLLLLHGRPAGESPAPGRSRIGTLIPAHDEELLIGSAVDSIFAADYPRSALQVFVVADNCSDGTAEVARAHGATVLERFDSQCRGKGHALAYAIEKLEFAGCDAIAIADADVIVDRGFYRAMDRELQRGARVLQGYDGMANPDESALTRLIAVTFVMKNLLYNAGKSALGFSTLFQGKGMVFQRDLLKARGWKARGLAEDHEEALILISEGERVEFVRDAVLYAQEASSLRQARTQRDRWAGGRQQLQRSARRMLVSAVRAGDWVLAEAALELLLPTYSKLLNLTLLAGALLGLSRLGAAQPPAWPLWLLGAGLALQVGEFALALGIMRASWRYIASVAFAPMFLVWKAAVDLRAAWGPRRTGWVRTDRIPHSDRP